MTESEQCQWLCECFCFVQNPECVITTLACVCANQWCFEATQLLSCSTFCLNGTGLSIWTWCNCNWCPVRLLCRQTWLFWCMTEGCKRTDEALLAVVTCMGCIFCLFSVWRRRGISPNSGRNKLWSLQETSYTCSSDLLWILNIVIESINTMAITDRGSSASTLQALLMEGSLQMADGEKSLRMDARPFVYLADITNAVKFDKELKRLFLPVWIGSIFPVTCSQRALMGRNASSQENNINVTFLILIVKSDYGEIWIGNLYREFSHGQRQAFSQSLAFF